MENLDRKKPSRKQREADLRKHEILEAAEKLFLANGYEDTTMNQIANEAEFSKGTLYNYFKSKEEAVKNIQAGWEELFEELDN